MTFLVSNDFSWLFKAWTNYFWIQSLSRFFMTLPTGTLMPHCDPDLKHKTRYYYIIFVQLQILEMIGFQLTGSYFQIYIFIHLYLESSMPLSNKFVNGQIYNFLKFGTALIFAFFVSFFHSRNVVTVVTFFLYWNIFLIQEMTLWWYIYIYTYT